MLSKEDFDLLMQDHMFSDDADASTSGEDSFHENSDNAETGDESGKENAGRWTNEEHELFLEGFRIHGKGWKKIASLIKSRSVIQVRTHAQKYFLKMAKAKQNGFDGVIPMDGSLSTGSLPRKRCIDGSADRHVKKNKVRKSSLFKHSMSSDVPPLSIGIGSLLYENPKLQDDSHTCISPSSIMEYEQYISNSNSNVYDFSKSSFGAGAGGGIKSTATVNAQNAGVALFPSGTGSAQAYADNSFTNTRLEKELLSTITTDVDISFDVFSNLASLADCECSWDDIQQQSDDARNSSISCDPLDCPPHHPQMSSAPPLISVAFRPVSGVNTYNDMSSSMNLYPSTIGNSFQMPDHLYGDGMFLGYGGSHLSDLPLSTQDPTSFSFGLLNDNDIDESVLDDELFTQDLLALNGNFS